MPSVLRGSFEHHLKGVADRPRGPSQPAKHGCFSQSNSAKGGTPNVVSRGFPRRISGIHVAKGFLLYLGPRAEAAFGAKKAGVVIDIWKCVGTRSVMAVANVDSLDTLDQILLDLPIMKEHGQHVQIDVTPLRRLEDFATDLKKRA